MRRYWREQPPPRMFRGAELARLMTGVVMLGVLYMMIARARDVDTWRWLVPPTSAAAPDAASATPPPPNPLPPATGPTDEDPEQAEESRNEFQAVTDGTLTLGPEEMEPYDRLVFWVENQSFERLCRRARSDLLFTNFYDEPSRYRGQLTTLEMNVRRILDAGKNRDGVQLHELWGFTTESRDRLYVAIVVGLPKEMPTGPSVYEKVRFAGYFFKLQGYHPAGAKAGDVPDKSPLLIGRVEWEPKVVAESPVSKEQEWTWGLGLLVVLAMVFLLRFVVLRWFPRKPRRRETCLEVAEGEVIPIETWLERSSFDAEDPRERAET